jgi:CopG-like RHH_1 or ribbon-helix-helix domain, RHH_5
LPWWASNPRALSHEIQFQQHAIHSKRAFRSPKRISITIAHQTYDNLITRSNAEGRSLSNLASFLLEDALNREGLSQ